MEEGKCAEDILFRRFWGEDEEFLVMAVERALGIGLGSGDSES